MNKITCFVVEDEPLAMNRIVRFIEKAGIFDIVETCVSTSELKKALDKNKVDLLFLDIQLAGDNSLEFVQNEKIDLPIVFTTAYDQYALESFEINVLDYLLKPFLYDRFEKTVEKIQRAFQNKQESIGEIVISSEHTKIKLPFDEIIYIESMKDYVKIFCLNRPKPILTRQNLKTFSSQLPPEIFTRVHRSFVVSTSKITKVGSTHLSLGNIQIPLGNNYKKEFTENYFNR